MTVDDHFLYQLRQQPDPEFVKVLKLKLLQYRSQPERRSNINLQALITDRKTRLVWIMFLVVASMLAVLSISPVRAFVSSLVISISDQLFEVTEDYPGDNYPGSVTVIEPQVMSLSEALVLFPHNVKLPVNTGITLNEDNVRVYVGKEARSFANTIEVDGVYTTGSGFVLRITDCVWNNGEIVAPEAVEEIILDDGHSAVLIRGGWDADKKVWDHANGVLRIRWKEDDLSYELMGNDLQQLVATALTILE